MLESALQSHQPAPPSTPQLEQAMFTGARDEEQDDHDEAVPVTTIGTGSFTLGVSGKGEAQASRSTAVSETHLFLFFAAVRWVSLPLRSQLLVLPNSSRPA